jgi:hypothetical protein
VGFLIYSLLTKTLLVPSVHASDSLLRPKPHSAALPVLLLTLHNRDKLADNEEASADAFSISAESTV